MGRLSTYGNFLLLESKWQGLKEHCEDILLPISDEGYDVRVIENKKIPLGGKILGFIAGGSIFPDIFIVMLKSGTAPTFDKLSPSLSHLISYMNDSNFSIFNFEVEVGSFFFKLFTDEKPVNKSVSHDPIEWLRGRLIETGRSEEQVSRINISFRFKK